MKSTLFIAVMFAMFLFSGNLYANEGMGSMDHEKGTMMGHDGSMMGQAVDSKNEMHVASEEDVKNLPNIGNKICPVSGNVVDDGKMGEAVKFVYNGKIYNLCCPMCIKDFKKNPEKYSAIAEKEVKGIK